MIQKQFAENVMGILETDLSVVGLAAAGSWITNEIDEYSDLDLVLVTRKKITQEPAKMLGYAQRFGKLLSGFTGEHVAEPRLLICLYADPLLHVDIKFVTPDEFRSRIENPAILLDRNHELATIISQTTAAFPYPGYQWIEDRFWTWIHYTLVKIQRGEYFEAVEAFGFLRLHIFGPLLHIKNNNLPRGVRKVEMQLPPDDINDLKLILPDYEHSSLINGLKNCIALYRKLRTALYDKNVILRNEAEKEVMAYFENTGSN